MTKIVVQNTLPADLPMIHQFFDASIRYQEARGYPSWRNYDQSALTRDIENKNQYKVIVHDKVAIVFSVCYADKIIWREREKGDAIYLHRIVVNPDFKGQKLFGEILNWAIEHARMRKLSYVRMDTWANNPTIISYYVAFGFRHIENYVTPDSPVLPVHNRKLGLALLEMIV